MRARVALNKAFERAGFTLVRITNHAIWRCPCGHTQVVSPTSPGKGRCTNNMDSLIARTLKVCVQNQRKCA
jgi:hypothetical protein